MHVTMIGEEDQIGLVGKSRFGQDRADTSEIPVEVFDHGVVSRQVAARPFLNPWHIGHVRTQPDPARRVASHPFSGSDVGVVRRLDGENGEKGLIGVSGGFVTAVTKPIEQEIGKRVRFVGREAIVEGVITRSTMHPRIPLAVVVLVA